MMKCFQSRKKYSAVALKALLFMFGVVETIWRYAIGSKKAPHRTPNVRHLISWPELSPELMQDACPHLKQTEVLSQQVLAAELQESGVRVASQDEILRLENIARTVCICAVFGT